MGDPAPVVWTPTSASRCGSDWTCPPSQAKALGGSGLPLSLQKGFALPEADGLSKGVDPSRPVDPPRLHAEVAWPRVCILLRVVRAWRQATRPSRFRSTSRRKPPRRASDCGNQCRAEVRVERSVPRTPVVLTHSARMRSSGPATSRKERWSGSTLRRVSSDT